jgi:hypothetical protein
MEARGDFKIFHEPSVWAHSSVKYPETVKNWFKPDSPKTFEEVREMILKEAETNNVFVKEMSFATKDFLLKDIKLIKNPQVYFVFLLRDPHHSVISFYNRMKNNFDSSDVIGYQAAYEIFQKVQHEAINPPFIISTEDLYNNPRATIEAFCAKLGIEFKEESMHWENLGSEFDGAQWHEMKYRDAVQHWHGNAIASTGFGLPSSYEIDQNENPTFAEIENEEHRKYCIKVYQENLIYYKLLQEQKDYWLKV